MRIVVLNGFPVSDVTGSALLAAVTEQIEPFATEARVFHLAGLAVGHCLGEFDCWIKTPGRCRIHDEGQEIERAVHDADVLVFTTPLSFGGYASTLKKAFDRLIPLILPFFRKAADFTHHAHRYGRLPRLVGIGWDPRPSENRRRLFESLVESNAINLGAPAWSATCLTGDAASWAPAIHVAVGAARVPGNASGTADAARAQLVAAMTAASGEEQTRAKPTVFVLNASPRPTGSSTSESLARYLGERLETAGAKVRHVTATAFLRDEKAVAELASAAASADVLVLSSPLYVDSIPYAGMVALERIAAARRSLSPVPPMRVVGLINCGFPEPEQNRFALLLLREFAAEAGAVFAGALPVGGGEAIHGRKLDEGAGMTKRLRGALDLAAKSLSDGGSVPGEASVAAANVFLPPALYRLSGSLGWLVVAAKRGMPPWDLLHRPFDDLSDAAWARMEANATRVRPLLLVERIVETSDTTTFVFHDSARHPVSFEAGQSITLDLDIDGERARRAYSLSSAPIEGHWSITVKRVPGGLVSNWLHDNLAVGHMVIAYGPSGRFVAGPRPVVGRRLLLVGGGSGIVPLAAILRQVLAEEADARVTLLYGSAAPERTIFLSHLEALAAVHGGRFRLDLVYETPPPGWTGERGRLDPATVVARLAFDPAAPFDQAMICGPDGMRAAVRDALLRLGLLPDQIIEESFTSPRKADVPAIAQAATLLGGPDPQTVTVAPGQTLLDAVLDAGFPISFSCCSGSCGACRVRITTGLDNVVLDEPNDVSDVDRRDGALPACIVRLRGPVSFAVP